MRAPSQTCKLRLLMSEMDMTVLDNMFKVSIPSIVKHSQHVCLLYASLPQVVSLYSAPCWAGLGLARVRTQPQCSRGKEMLPLCCWALASLYPLSLSPVFSLTLPMLMPRRQSRLTAHTRHSRAVLLGTLHIGAGLW